MSGPRDLSQVLALLAHWARQGWLRELDRAFAAFLARQAPDAPPLLVLAAALASAQLARGHVCLDLREMRALAGAGFAPARGHATPQPDEGIEPLQLLAGIAAADWLAAARPGALVSAGEGDTPLVLDGTRLYLRRYWRYEQSVRAAIDARLADTVALRAAIPLPRLRAALDALFPARADATTAAAAAPDWQKLACALMAGHRFGIVTGGPGTGKTTTVVRLLALLQSLALGDGDGAAARPLRIRLAAPTGKAAARLNAAIAQAIDRLPLDALPQGAAVRAAVPSEVTTLHRLLGSRPDTRRFRHDAANPLALDVLVVDEASMVDLEMLAAVLDALPASARLLLLGDKDQLASVEAGAVLGALCARAAQGHYRDETCDWLAAATGVQVDADLRDAAGTPLDQAVAMLRQSHRFAGASGIGRLAEAVNAGDPAAVEAVWATGSDDLARLDLAQPGTDGAAALRALVLEGGSAATPGAADRLGYGHYLRLMAVMRPAEDAASGDFDAWAAAVLAAHARFQLLGALRHGPWGVEGLNTRIATALAAAGLIARTEGWYAGRPVLVTRNDAGLGLMNGDIGLALARSEIDAATGARRSVLRVAFAAGGGGPGGAGRAEGVRWVAPSRLAAVETVYALTVHKAQGSESEHVALLLPPRLNPVLTRELVYTGITRARRWFTLVEADAAAGVLAAATRQRVSRTGGLRIEAGPARAEEAV